jgi:serine/threonine protein kinase
VPTELIDQFKIIRPLRRSKGFRSFVVKKSDDSREFVLRVFSENDASHEWNEPFWQASLRHPSFAQIFEVGSLKKRNRFELREFFGQPAVIRSTAEFLSGITTIVGFLEQHSLIHGAIHPGNLFWNAETLVLADRPWFTRPLRPTDSGIVYSAPEIHEGCRFSFEADLYSLGVLLYEAIAGCPLFEDASVQNLRYKCLHAKPRPLRTIAKVSAEIAEAVDTLLEKGPHNRSSAFRAISRIFRTEPPPSSDAVFIGRQTEFDLAKRIASERGGFRTLVIRGGPGSGKTRFLLEIGNFCRLRGFSTRYVDWAIASSLMIGTHGKSQDVTQSQVEGLAVSASRNGTVFPTLKMSTA